MNEQAPDKRVCFRCLVAGRVQGVFSRAATREQAQRLGLTGYARNLSDGRVEVLVCGEPDLVGQLREVRPRPRSRGSPASRVLSST